MNRSFWNNKKVFLTGHTGFKGGWLAIWLADMGAKVHGYSLLPSTDPNFFTEACVENHLASSTIADIRDAEKLSATMQNIAPDIVLHLAAQSLVRHSYIDPVETYAVNVMGTVNLFEAVRKSNTVKAIVNVTTDKCYENREWVWPYRENEAMGGFDPYSSSKGCAELVTSAYRRSFFEAQGVRLASARAGNVIGGGDWAKDRLIPDFLRAIDANQVLTIRSPNATRPWQHVLEPLSGYLMLGEALHEGHDEMAAGWNFGPNEIDARPVQWILEYLRTQIPNVSWECDTEPQPHEANSLKLDSSKANSILRWKPRWKLEEALAMTLSWHKAWRSNADMTEISLEQIRAYESLLVKKLARNQV